MTVTLDGLSVYETRSESRDQQPRRQKQKMYGDGAKGEDTEPNKWKMG